MGKRLRIIFAVGVVAVLAVAGWFFWPSREPYYQGKPLTYWLRGYDYFHYVSWDAMKICPIPKDLNFDSFREADAAVDHLGTNAIPTLLQLLQTRDTAFELRLRGWVMRSKLSKYALKYHLITPLEPSYLRLTRVKHGFGALGTNGIAAVPGLRQMCDQDLDELTQGFVLSELIDLAPNSKEAIAALLHVASNHVAHSNAQTLPGSRTALQLLDSALIERGCKKPELIVPALTICLQDSDTAIRISALEGLYTLGVAARPAAPAVMEIIRSNTGPMVGDAPQLKEVAERVLKEIDPEAAAKLQQVQK